LFDLVDSNAKLIERNRSVTILVEIAETPLDVAFDQLWIDLVEKFTELLEAHQLVVIAVVGFVDCPNVVVLGEQALPKLS